jgi:hypothetical protein
VGSSWGQLRTQERELSRLKKAAERAAAGAAAAEAAREEAARGAEEEVERLQAELVASRVRQEDALTKQREAQSSLKVRLQSALSSLDFGHSRRRRQLPAGRSSIITRGSRTCPNAGP